MCVAFLLVIAQAAAQSNTLVLTDYILAGNAAGGKNASKVTSENLLASDLVSYSGYFRISMNPFRHLFFWFFPCEYQPQNKPLLLWLQGGPGQSAMVAIMEEFGPFVLNGDISAVRYSPNSWTQDYNILFFDNPIGTGFSFSNASADSSYSATVEDVADNLYHALIQFFMVFPEFRTNRFYIAGESYAGKYVPTLAYQIMNYNSRPTTSIRINLKGLY
ncbi:putative serine carboxypeptidase CPVL [Blattella germanica]|nr:putative serine carboxypeptidase CPVL [Blattella germanica]